MKIGIDIGCLGISDERLKVGVYNVAKNMLLELSKLDKKNIYFLYSFYPIEKKIISSLGNNFRLIVLRPKKGWFKIWLPLRLKRDNLDIFIGLNQSIPYLSSNVIKIGFIYDLAFLEHPNFYIGSLNKLKENTKRLANKSDQIITISTFVKKSICKTYKISSKKVNVIYPGVRLNVKRGNVKKYFLYVGSLKKGKNLPNIIKGFELFLMSSNFDTKLIIIGGDVWIDPEIEVVLKKLSQPIKKKVIFKGHVSDKILRRYYSQAYAFVSPSYYEGFGVTHAESMSLGIPVIASNKGSLPEIVKGGGLFVNPSSPNDISKAMVKLVKNRYQYKILSINGKKKSKDYSWKKFGVKFYEIIQKYEKNKNSLGKRDVSQQV